MKPTVCTFRAALAAACCLASPALPAAQDSPATPPAPAAQAPAAQAPAPSAPATPAYLRLNTPAFGFESGK